MPPAQAEDLYYVRTTAKPTAELSHQYVSGLAGRFMF